MSLSSAHASSALAASDQRNTGIPEHRDTSIEKVCCWCGSSFVRIGDFFWCRTRDCRDRQASHSIWVQEQGDDGTNKTIYLYVPLPRQVEFDACLARYLLGGGAAGSTKSYAGRWAMYRRALRYPGYTGLILRQTWGELESTHFELMDKEQLIFQEYGINAVFSKTNRQMVFTHPDGKKSIIEGGHMDDANQVKKYLGRERDEIMVDEGSLFDPKALRELSTRARTTKIALLRDGIRGLFRVYTNPGGPSSSMLRELFIDHDPVWENYPARFREVYNPSDWVYIPGRLEDNPYLDDAYEADLALLETWRYEQLRYNNWDVVAGLFFEKFVPRAPFVQDLGDPGSSVQWFRCMDWGYVNPGCVLWIACLPDGINYVRAEYKFSHTLVDDVSTEIHERTRDHDIQRVRYTIADPSLWKVTSHDTGELISETFMKPPNRVPMVPGDNRRLSGWQRVRENLRIRSDGNPTLVIHPDCRYLIRSLSNAVSDKNNPEDIDTDIDDHALDTLRYGLMSRPSPTKTIKVGSGKTFKAKQAQIKRAKAALRRR